MLADFIWICLWCGGLAVLVVSLANLFILQSLIFGGSCCFPPLFLMFISSCAALLAYPPWDCVATSPPCLPLLHGRWCHVLPASLLGLPPCATRVTTVTLVLSSLFWCLYWFFYSAFLNDMGLGLPRISSLCFITPDECWRVGGTPRVECLQQEGKQPLFLLSAYLSYSVWSVLLLVCEIHSIRVSLTKSSNICWLLSEARHYRLNGEQTQPASMEPAVKWESVRHWPVM